MSDGSEKSLRDQFQDLMFLFFGMLVNWAVIVILWRWFMVPTFGLPEITMPQVGGINLILTLFRGPRLLTSVEKTSTYQIVKKSLEVSLFCLFLGFVLSWMV